MAHIKSTEILTVQLYANRKRVKRIFSGKTKVLKRVAQEIEAGN